MRILFALAAYYSWFIEHLDVVIVYLNSDIDVHLYVELPDGYKERGAAALLRKTIYGLKQSARQWNKNLSAKLFRAGLTRLMSDYSVFNRNAGIPRVVIVIIYVDDFLAFGPNMSEIKNLKRWLAANYKMKDLGPCSQFLGMKVERDEERRTISISQEAFINKALTAADMQNCKGVTSPMIVNSKLAQNPESAADAELIQLYQSHIGTQMWAYICTRPDLGFSVSTLSRFSSNPTPEHIGAVKRVYRYLQDTKDYKLVYHGGHRDHIKLEIYTDADWAGDIETRKSTSGYVALLNGTAISWSSKRQTTVAQFLCEAEYIAASEAVKEAVWIGRFLEELHQIRIYPIPIYCDNQGAIALAKNPENHQRTKHIDVRYHYIREKEEDGTIEIRYLPTEQMVADGLTKSLPSTRQTAFVEQLGLERERTLRQQ